MQKYLVVREKSGSKYHIFHAEGTAKECNITGTTSLCSGHTEETIDREETLSACKARYGTLAILSRGETEICRECLTLI